jgi:hypothetical protein
MNKKMTIPLLFLISWIVMAASPMTTNSTNQVADDLIGSVINVAVSPTYAERRPAVSYCNYHYLVVYERENGIWGQRLDPGGGLVGSAFLIYKDSDTKESYDPDVACHYDQFTTKSYFIVVWTYHYGGSDTDIRAQAVYDVKPGASDLFGDMLIVSQDTVPESAPAIACNQDDDSCLVVYERGSPSVIQGQRISVGASDINSEGDRLTVNTVAPLPPEREPSIVWAQDQESYMVVWIVWSIGDSPGYVDHYELMKALVYDTEQGTGVTEVRAGPTWMNPTTTGPDQRYPSVAYNDLTGRFLVAFQQVESPLKTYIMVFDSNEIFLNPELFGPASGPPVVAFSGGTQYNGNPNPESEFLVSYVYNYQGSQHFWSYVDGFKIRDPYFLWKFFEINEAAEPKWNANPDVVGNQWNGEYLIAWEQENSGEYNVYAQLVDHSNYSYINLPLVIR